MFRITREKSDQIYGQFRAEFEAARGGPDFAVGIAGRQPDWVGEHTIHNGVLTGVELGYGEHSAHRTHGLSVRTDADGDTIIIKITALGEQVAGIQLRRVPNDELRAIPTRDTRT